MLDLYYNYTYICGFIVTLYDYAFFFFYVDQPIKPQHVLWLTDTVLFTFF